MNKVQQSKIKEMKQIVGEQVPDHICLELLKKTKWDTNAAIGNFYSLGHAEKYGNYQGSANLNEQNCKALFANYQSNSKIDGDGMQQFFSDIQVDLEDIVTVAVSKLMEAKTNEWTYDQFKTGCGKVGADTIPGWVKAIPTLQQKLAKDEALYHQVYDHAFDISQEPGLKNIDGETAVVLWGLFMKKRCPFLDLWLAFIDQSKDHKIIKKDEWQMFYSICKATKGNFDNFADIDDGTWPLIIDEFNEYYQSKK